VGIITIIVNSVDADKLASSMRFIIVAAAVLTKGAVSQAAVATKAGQVSFEAAKCSACGAVAQELLLALDHEVKQRKITPSPSSTDLAVPLTESRFFDILESVCSRMEVSHTFRTIGWSVLYPTASCLGRLQSHSLLSIGLHSC